MNMTIIMSYRTSPRSDLFETMILQQNATTKWSNKKYVMYSYQGQCLKNAFWMYLNRFETAEMNSDSIWKDWELQKSFENNVSKACTVTVFEKAAKKWKQCQ